MTKGEALMIVADEIGAHTANLRDPAAAPREWVDRERVWARTAFRAAANPSSLPIVPTICVGLA